MIVFDLKCSAGHVFEAWFGSSAAFEEQRDGGLVACPMCGDAAVEKAVMAPNVAAKGNRAPMAAAAPPVPAAVKSALAAMAAAQAKLLESSQWVGAAFTEKARAMHLGEEAEAPIHGQATLEQAKSLLDEGVAVAPLPFPAPPPDSLN